MRSDKIHRALSQGINRFEVCQLVSKGVRAAHKSGSRFEDSINDILEHLSTHSTTQKSIHAADAERIAAKAMKPAA
jgi:hypothetical protein